MWTYAYVYYIDTKINAITNTPAAIPNVTITKGTSPAAPSTPATATIDISSRHKIAIPIPKDKPKEIKDITIIEKCQTDGKGVPHTGAKLTITPTGTLTIEGTIKTVDGKVEFENADQDKCITIEITDAKKPATVLYGHVFTETFDLSHVHWQIISLTLMVIVGIIKSKGIYDPYVWMGNWGGSHEAATADGDLTLTPSTSGSYTSGASTGNEITLNIYEAKYKTDTAAEEKGLVLNTGSNTLQLTSGTDITTGGETHTLTRTANGLNLTLKTADSSITTALNNRTYNVSLKITKDITLTGNGCKLKKTNDQAGNQTPVSLSTYTITSGGNGSYSDFRFSN